MNIALIAPSGVSGGVATVVCKLHRSLISEGIRVDKIRPSRGKFPLLSTICYDILNAKYLAKYDLTLYVGSIPWPSHILAKLSGVPIALFVHGYVYHELLHAILHGAGLRSKIGTIIPATMFKTAISLNTIDLYICHSLTACEANKISKDRSVLLPQWLLPEELEFSKTLIGAKKGKSAIRIVTYTSYADSPRLLNTSHLITLARVVRHMTKREFELIIVDPKGSIATFEPVKITRFMPQQEFLSLLASADLFIEGCIDEELRLGALTAMALGTPVAKLTHQRYWDRQDYNEEDLILACSFRELSEKIAEYIKYIEHYYPYYSKCVKKFVETKRTWDAVKGPFLTTLKHIS